MKKLFITKSTISYGLSTATGDIAGTWESDVLTTGSLAFVDGDGVLLDDTTPSITTDSFGILLGTEEGVEVLQSLDRENLTYQKQTYLAAVKAVKYLGSDEDAGNTNGYSLNLPSSISAGDIVGIYITDLTKSFENTSRTKSYQFPVVTGDLLTGQTARNIIAKLVALINADSNAVVVAAAVDDGTDNDGIKFTAKTAGNDFSISLLGSHNIVNVLQDAQIVEYLRVDGEYDASSTNAVASKTAQGDAVWLAQFETDMSTYDGNINSDYLKSDMFSRAAKTSSAQTYTLYTLTTRRADDSVLIKEQNPDVTIYIAVPNADTGSGKHIFAIDNILSVL